MKRIDEIVKRYGLSAEAGRALEAVLTALEAEPKPPTTVRDRESALDRHVADSLAALDLPEVAGASGIADLGSGAGFPGLALAVALPRAQVDLIEASGRKCEVIERLIAAAGLANARALPVRAEEWGVSEGREDYDLVTARALAALPVVTEYAAPLLRLGGALVVWRGVRDPVEEETAERAAAALGLGEARVVRVEPFPGARNRHLHVYAKLAPTPERFPRRPGVAAKRPLG